MEEEITITVPTRYAQFPALEAYQSANLQIVEIKDEASGGEYTRTGTLYEYNPEPEPEWDGKYYMTATADMVEAGVFEGVTLLDSVPAPELPNDTWTKAEIQTYLTNNGIEWKVSWSKAQLLAAV
jgi:hypothetical protein